MRGAVFTLELKVPPPVVALLIGVLMWLVSRVVPWSEFTLPNRSLIALVAALAGFIVSSLGFFSFRRAGTTVNPTKPSATTSLVVVGVYRLTRNPMYVGLLLLLLAWATYLSSAVAFIFLPVFVLYINRFQIQPEERVLELKFGSEYAAYKGRVRRWL